MSNRFNRNDANVPDDRLFPDDFQVDQGGQDEDIGRLVKDLGCLPCIGGGLDVTQKTTTPPAVEISQGWAYDVDGDYGRRITVSSPQDVELPTDEYNVDRFIVIAHKFVTDTPRNAHRTGTIYDTRKKDSFEITVETSLGIGDICLAKCVQPSEGADIQITIEGVRLSRECKLVSQDKVPGVIPEGEEEAGKPPPPGSKPELPDYPKGRDVPMPIILTGTRDGSSWNGIETVLRQDLGRTAAVTNTLTLERVNLKSGTPLADVQIWIGDWGTGIRDSGNHKKCNFTMPAESGVSGWDDDLWITDPPKYYYLVRSDESWHSKITDSGDSWVLCENDLPDADSHEFYICPYAEKYRGQAFPYKTDAEINLIRPKTADQFTRTFSPVAPIVMIENLNLGGKYKLKVASVVSGDNYTQWVSTDFIVGQDLVMCWYPASENITVTPVDGGVQVTIPGKASGVEPEAYELCYTYGLDPATIPDPDFDNPEHSTVRTSERVIKLDIPPGYAIKVIARAVSRRIIMRCLGVDKTLTPADSYVTAGGVGLRRNRKAFTGLIDETQLPETDPDNVVLVDEIPLPNPVWPEKILLFNPTGESETDFEVYIHGGNQNHTSGRKFQIGTGGDESEVGPRGSQEKGISDYRITDDTIKVTLKNIGSAPQDIKLRYSVQYREDAEGETA
ncbi:hypothetical protein KAX06_02440 [candidate division WOR-3 bacterium]|nr:hypothetical protein [candidate division WOR-3 bacterium]